MIPKIVHQLGPTDRNKWHALWNTCHASWLEHHQGEYQVRVWNDEEAEQLVKDHYSEFYEMYKAFPFSICRVDFVRFCILHKFGGLYADLDYYCYSNFFNELSEKCYVVGSPMNFETVQNSLMAGEPEQKFFLECMRKVRDIFYTYSKPYVKGNVFVSNEYVLDVTGPRMLSKAIEETKENVLVMPIKIYNPPINFYSPEIKAKHMMTGSWASDHLDEKMKAHMLTNKFSNFQEFMENDYKEFRNVDLKTYKFKPE